MPTHILGIRHHGPGSARHVLEFLEQHPPDVLLVEGPPDANAMIAHVTDDSMQPPVAILAYQTDQPQQASFYPFAEFSPEWQAIQYGQQHSIPVRFMDLPLAHRFARFAEPLPKDGAEVPPSDAAEEASSAEPSDDAEATQEGATLEEAVAEHPLSHLARAAGFSDTELWWEHQFELRLDHEDSFAAILEGVTALRDTLTLPEDKENELREAYMRKILYEAERDAETVVVVCGAWHAPALVQRSPLKDDRALLKGLPKVKVSTTWIPWTYNRLTFASGYGAGVHSPGWYHHWWKTAPEQRGYGWMTQVARVFRQHQMDTSTAHVIEAVRLADALAGLRALPRPGLSEYNEATNTVLSFGDDSLLTWVREDLIVGQRMGEVPAKVPAVPLQSDVQALQRSLRMKPSNEQKELTLDLRKDLDRNRSVMLHRLQLLEIGWGHPSYASGQGTFKEAWRLQWKPEMAIQVVEKGVWGNTVEAATTGYVQHQLAQADQLVAVASLLEKTIPAALPAAVASLMRRIDELAAVSGDIFQLMQALPPLANVSRYGDVRQTDTAMIDQVLDSLVTRIGIGLPNACTALNDDSAAGAQKHIVAVNEALQLLRQEAYDQAWQTALRQIVDHEQVHGSVAGKVCRILSERSVLQQEEVTRRFSLALSPAQAVGYSAAWLEGFLDGSGALLLLDETLWSLLNQWVGQLDGEVFAQTLPILRRSFATFTKPERRKLGEKAKSDGQPSVPSTARNTEANFNHERAVRVLPTIKQLLGFSENNHTDDH